MMAKKSPKSKNPRVKRGHAKDPSADSGKKSKDRVDSSSSDSDGEDESVQLCLKCEKNVCPLDNALQSEKYHYWSHIGCVGITKKAYETLQELKTTMWFCKGCFKTAKQDIEGATTFKSNMRAMKDELVAIKSEIVKKNTNEREAATETKATTTGGTKQDLEGKLEGVIKEREEVEKRKRNIIVHGLPEKRADGTERNDTDALKEMCRDINIPEVEVFQLTRLGSKEPPQSYREKTGSSDRPWTRPLLVKLKDEDTKFKILRAARELRSKLSHAYITADLTPKQRDAERELRKKCKTYNKQNKDGESEAYILREQMAFRAKRSR